VIAKNIHGLHAKRTRGRSGDNREAEEAARTREVHTRRHNTILAIHGGRKRRYPSIGMRDVQTTESLDVALAGARDETIQGSAIH
jgi:hypothetical protein